MKASKILLNICSFACFVYFALYLFSLVFIPVGIYCFLAGKLFCYKADHPEDDMKISKTKFKAYVIFASIACFPFGLLSIIPYYFLASNKIRVSGVSESQPQSEPQPEPVAEVVTPTVEETEAEKMEKFKKLQSFKEKGLITEEELEQAREQLFGSSDKD